MSILESVCFSMIPISMLMAITTAYDPLRYGCNDGYCWAVFEDGGNPFITTFTEFSCDRIACEEESVCGGDLYRVEGCETDGYWGQYGCYEGFCWAECETRANPP